MFAQVEVGDPAGVGRRCPVREASTLAHLPFFRPGGEAETSSAGGPGAGQVGGWGLGWGKASGPGRDWLWGWGGAVGEGRLSPEPGVL